MNRWLSLVQLLTPLILNAINPSLGLASTAIIHGITEAEALKNSPSSAEKLAHAKNITNDVVSAINTASNKTVVDPVLVNKTADSVISTIVDVVNLVNKTNVPTSK